MSLLDSLAARRRAAGSESLMTVSAALVFLIVHAAGVWSLSSSGRTWWFDCAVGLVVCGLALARELSRLAMATAGIVVAVAASLAAGAWHLPAEPGGAVALALVVLVAAAVRSSSLASAVAIATAGAALTGVVRELHPGIGAAALGLWCCALTAGLLLRFFDYRRQAAPGAGRLTGLIDRFARCGVPVQLQVADDLTWPPELTATICRVVHEALASITRHAAPAIAVTVTITRDQDTISVEVADDAWSVRATVPVASRPVISALPAV